MIFIVCEDLVNILSAVPDAIHLLGKYLSEIGQMNHIPKASISLL